MNKKIIWLFLLLVIGISCRKINYTESEIQCVGAGREGNVQLKIWSYGITMNQSINSAKRKAVEALLFKGVSNGNQGNCPNDPIIKDFNTQEKQRKFFEDFFRDKGPYLQFVSQSGDGSINAQDRVKVGRKYKIGVFMIVNHRALKSYMEQNNIIRKLTTGF